MALSIVYIFSIIAAIVALLSIPKTETKLIWLPICAYIEIGIFCLVFGILNSFGAPFSLFTPLLTNIAIIFGVCIFHYHNQKITISSIKAALARWRNLGAKTDVIVTAGILITVICCALVQFGFPFSVSFITSDPSIHLLCAIDLFNGSSIITSFFTHSVTACFIATIEPFIDPLYYYSAFVFEELLQFFLSGAMLYSVLAISMKNSGTAIKLILVVLYMLGYPWNNMIYGFSYLGAGVTSICGLIFLMIKFEKYHSVANEKSKNVLSEILLLVGISLMLLNLIISYPLFVPPVYLAVFISVILYGKRHEIKTASIIQAEIGLFAVPVILGYFLVFLPLFGTSSEAVSSALAADGAIFKDFYHSFIFIIPLALYGIILRIRIHKIQSIEILIFVFIGFFMCCLALTAIGRVSPYYFFKLYYPLWLLVFFYTALGVDELRKKSPTILACYSGIWLLIIFMIFSNIGTVLGKDRPFVKESLSTENLLPVYEFNVDEVGIFKISSEEMELFSQAKALKADGYTVNPFANDLLSFWALSLLEDRNLLLYWVFDDNQLSEIVDESDYIVLFNAESGMVSRNDTFLPELSDMVRSKTELVFQNDAGEIRKVANPS